MRFFVFVILCLMVSSAFCQKARLGGLPQSTMVVTNEADAAAMQVVSNLSSSVDALEAFAATNHVRTWTDEADPLSFWVETGSTNRTKYTRTLTGTNFTVELSADFLATSYLPDRPIWTNNTFPFTDGAWFGDMTTNFPSTVRIVGTDGDVWSALASSFPVELAPQSAGSQGTATVSIASYTYTTNAGPSYILVTGNVWTAIGTAQATAAEAMEAADLTGGYLNTHLNDTAPHDGLFAPASATNAPAWIGVTNYAASVTVTNMSERPQFLYATGDVSVAFSGLRTPQPFYFVLRGPTSVAFPSGTHFVGGGAWQTNMSNHFVVWQYGTNLFVNPVTTSED